MDKSYIASCSFQESIKYIGSKNLIDFIEIFITPRIVQKKKSYIVSEYPYDYQHLMIFLIIDETL